MVCTLRRVGFLLRPTRNTSSKSVSFIDIENYGPGMGRGDRDDFHSSDESDEELTRALELSRKEF
jgi:hypothetical protein